MSKPSMLIWSPDTYSLEIEGCDSIARLSHSKLMLNAEMLRMCL